jgi:hypothetical protein
MLWRRVDRRRTRQSIGPPLKGKQQWIPGQAPTRCSPQPPHSPGVLVGQGPSHMLGTEPLLLPLLLLLQR